MPDSVPNDANTGSDKGIEMPDKKLNKPNRLFWAGIGRRTSRQFDSTTESETPELSEDSNDGDGNEDNVVEERLLFKKKKKEESKEKEKGGKGKGKGKKKGCRSVDKVSGYEAPKKYNDPAMERYGSDPKSYEPARRAFYNQPPTAVHE